MSSSSSSEPSEVILDSPYDFGTVIAGNSYDHTIQYHIEGDQGKSPVTIISTKLSCSEPTINLDHKKLRFYGKVMSETISPDHIKFQNNRYKRHNGDISNEISLTGLNKIFTQGYGDTVLYVFKSEVGRPTERTITINATIEYDVVIPPPETSTGGGSSSSGGTGHTERRTAHQSYTIEFRKNFNTLAQELQDMVAHFLPNQAKLDKLIADGVRESIIPD